MLITDEAELRKRSGPASSFEIEGIVRKLVDELAKHPNGVGLSAPQIGIFKRVAIVNGVNGLIILANPVVVMHTGAVRTNEGCLSFPGEYIDTLRWHTLDVESLGQVKRYSAVTPEKKLECVAVQHEIDHLSGILFRDRAVVSNP